MIWIAALICGACTPAPSQVSSPSAAASPNIISNTGSNIIRLTNGEWAPYDGKDLEHNGCDAWVISEAFALQGIQVEYGFFPWARGYHLAEDGTYDGAVDWADTPDHRAKFYLSADYVSKQEWVFFYRADRPFEWSSLDDLKGKSIGITSGYVYSDKFKDLMKSGEARFAEASTDEANLRKLLAGRIDVFPIERSVGITISREIFTQAERAQIKIHPTPFDEFLPYLLLTRANPGNQQRIQAFDQGLKELKDNGRYAEIMRSCLPTSIKSSSGLSLMAGIFDQVIPHLHE